MAIMTDYTVFYGIYDNTGERFFLMWEINITCPLEIFSSLILSYLINNQSFDVQISITFISFLAQLVEHVTWGIFSSLGAPRCSRVPQVGAGAFWDNSNNVTQLGQLGHPPCCSALHLTLICAIFSTVIWTQLLLT
jgi:hypothetical protein